MTDGRHERGIALASVLWSVAALSLIAAAMLSSSMHEARIGRNAWAQLQVQTAADAGVERAILSLFDPRAERRWPVDGTPRDIVFDGTNISVAIQDEAGRIDLNYANHTFLHDLFKAAGAEPAQADALADRVIDWRTPKNTRSLNGATADDYRNAGYAWLPRGGPFQSVDELALVMGMTPQILARVAPALTVYSHQRDFDLRVAPKEALLAVPGMDEARAEQTIAARDAPSARPGPALSGGAPVPIPVGHAFSITAMVRQDRIRFMRQAVVQISADPAHPFRFMAWK